MRGDGDGWVECRLGHRHWGRHGAAGLLLYTVTDGEAFVLLQHRAPWCHHGDTWGIPGGARDSHEGAVEAALRESAEEASLDGTKVRVHRETVDDHGDWAYTTVVGLAGSQLPTSGNKESLELRWQPLVKASSLALHPGFAATWPSVQAIPIRIVVDDAPEAQSLVNTIVSLPNGRDGVVLDVSGVNGSAMAEAPDRAHLVVVSRDHRLAERLPAATQVVGAGWLQGALRETRHRKGDQTGR